MSVIRNLLGEPAERSQYPPYHDPVDNFIPSLYFGGNQYPLGYTTTMQEVKQEIADGTFSAFAHTGYRSNGVVFACMLARLSLFTEARFKYRRLRDGRPGELFGGPTLAPLETPWPGGTTGDLLAKLITHHDLAGNAYPVRSGDGMRALRPDWVTMVIGSRDGEDIRANASAGELVGLLYFPGGRELETEPEVFLPGSFGHFAFTPDPEAQFRGMSWLTPIVREYAADSAARDHKLAFFERAATPNMVVRLDKDSAASQTTEAFGRWVDEFKKKEPRGRDAYKTMYLAAGADVTVVGSDLKQLDFKMTQGAGESRLAAAAGVPPVIVGLSEGLQAATYSNYGQARRRFADLTMRPLWRNIAGSLASMFPVPTDAEMWYDDRDIPFLQEDRKDASEIAQMQASTIRTLLDAGYLPDSVIAAVNNEDWSLLDHSGLYSVQLQPPGTGESDDVEDARARLVASGVKRPTQAQLAAELGVSERTLRRWQA